MFGFFRRLYVIERSAALQIELTSRVLAEVRRLMATLDETLALVTQQTTHLASLNAFVAGLKDQLAAALAGEVTPTGQAKLDAIFAAVESNDQAIVDAIAANVPPATE